MKYNKYNKKMKTQEKKNITIIDFTEEVLDRVQEIYNNKLMQDKALFLLYLINREGKQGYQLHSTNHRSILSFQNGKKWGEFLDALVDNKLIICTTPHVAKQKSKTYIINTDLAWKPNNGELKKRYYGEQYDMMPTWIQQFHLDGHVVKSPANSKWSKEYKYTSQQEEENVSLLKFEISLLSEKLDSQQHEIEELKLMVKQLMNGSNSTSVDFTQEVTPNEELETLSSILLNANTSVELMVEDDGINIIPSIEEEKSIENNYILQYDPEEEAIDFGDNESEQVDYIAKLKSSMKQKIYSEEAEAEIKRYIRRQTKDVSLVKKLVDEIIYNVNWSKETLIKCGLSGASSNQLYNDITMNVSMNSNKVAE